MQSPFYRLTVALYVPFVFNASLMAQTPAPTNSRPESSLKSPFFDTLYDNEITPLPTSASVDTRLQGTVTFSSRSVSLTRFVQKLSEQTNVNFTLHRALTNHKIYVRLVNCPVKEVLTGLAQMYGSHWVASEHGYTLQLTPQATRIQRRWWQTFGQEQSNFIGQMKNRLRDNIRRPPLTESQITAIPDKDIQPNVRMANREQVFWHALSDGVIQQLTQQLDFSVLYLLIPTVNKILSEGGVYVPLETLPQEARNGVLSDALNFQKSLKPENYIGCVIFGEFAGLHASPINYDGNKLLKTDAGPTLNFVPNSPEEMAQGFQPTSATLLNQRPLRFQLQSTKKQAIPSSWRTLAAYEGSTFFASSNLQQNENPSDSSYILAPYLPDCLDIVLDKKSENCLADVPSLPVCSPSNRTLEVFKGDLTLQQMLVQSLKGQDVSWKETKGLLLIRHNRWYRNDLLETSPDAMQKLCDTYHQLMTAHTKKENEANDAKEPTTLTADRHLTLKETMDLTALAPENATLWQIASGMRFYIDDQAYQAFAKKHSADNWSQSESQPLANVAKILFNYPQQCAFYRSLSSPQREAFLQGELRFSDLSFFQLNLLEKANVLASVLRQKGQTVSAKIGLIGSPLFYQQLLCIAPDGTRTSEIFGGSIAGEFQLSTSIVIDKPSP